MSAEQAKVRAVSDPEGPGRPEPADQARRFGAFESPFLRAPEEVRTVFLVILAAACGPLIAGVVFFGWRALVVAALSVAGCATVEWLFYRVSRVPALLGRSHAYLTGLLLALTLPPFVPWYVPLNASVFAIIVGKAIFGGVGHFLWQPALVGRLSVAVLMSLPIFQPNRINPPEWPILAQNRVVVGDVTASRRVRNYLRWRGRAAPQQADAFLLTPPGSVLAGLTHAPRPMYSGLVHLRCDPATGKPIQGAKPAALLSLPPINDLLYGARPGGIGETSAVIIVVCGLYLIYRNYVKWQLPAAFVLSAVAVVAVAPIKLAGPYGAPEVVWWPVFHEGVDVGLIYILYQLLSCELLLAAFFLATEMTSRPVTTGSQTLFGLGCGTVAMLLKLYVDAPIPCYMAVLAVSTFTPTIEAIWRPAVLGQPGLLARWFRRGR